MINDYKEASYKFVDGDFHGRIYEFLNGETVRHDVYKDVEEFQTALEQTDWASMIVEDAGEAEKRKLVVDEVLSEG
jgi:hypothetical protein